MIRRIFKTQTKNVTLAAGILIIATLLSRLLGLVRSRLLASFFGAGSELDVYFAAFRLPDLVFNILIAGGVLVSFLPIFSEYFSKDKEDAWGFVNNLLSVFFFLLVLVSAVFFLFASFFVKIIAPGFNQEQLSLAVSLTRLMFLSPIILGLSNIFSGILQYFNRFVAYSLSPVVYNIGIIFGIIFFAPSLGIFGVAIGVILGALLHLIIQILASLNCGFRYISSFNIIQQCFLRRRGSFFFHKGIKKVFVLMIPRILGIAASQINLLAITAIASILAVGSISIFNFANDFYYIPIGVIGVSFAVASFPSLSKSWIEDKKEEFINTFSLIFRQIIFLVLPISFLMFFLRDYIIQIILGAGKFGLVDQKLTSASLGLFSLSILFGALIPLIFRIFFSMKDTKTPTIISVGIVFLNILLSFYFSFLLTFENQFRSLVVNLIKLEGIDNISVIGLPLAFSVSTFIQFLIFMFFIYKKIDGFKLKEIIISFLKTLMQSIVMILVLIFSFFFIDLFFDIVSFWEIILKLSFSLLLSLGAFVGMAFLFNSKELTSVVSFVFKGLRKNDR